MRRERDARVRAAGLRERGLDFRHVRVRGEAVGEEVLVRLRVAEGARAAAPRAGHAALRVDDDALELDQALFRERREREERGRGITAGIREARRARDLRALPWELGKPVGPAVGGDHRFVDGWTY